ncbi:MAG: right-handed parallel beta-helix repeat-containing protein [Planctomycetota bacterium JB042]
MNRLPIATLALACIAVAPATSSGSTSVGGPIFASTTWTTAGSPYCVTSSVIVGNGATLTIQPGVTVVVNQNLSISVGSSVFGSGTLVAIGTPGQPIRFTGALGTPGSWNELFFDPVSTDASYGASNEYVAGSTLQHCTVEFAGGSGTGALRVNECSPFLSHVTVRDNTSDGLVVTHSVSPFPPPLRIESCQFDANTKNGLTLSTGNGVGHSVLDCSAQANSLRGFSIVSAPSLTFSRNTATKNLGGGIAISGCANAVITENTADENKGAGSGGGFSIFSSPTSVIEDNSARDNQSSSGGGFSLSSCGGSTLSRNSAIENQANQGGNAYISSCSSTSLTDSVFRNGSASSVGGGLLVISSSSFTIDRCVFEDNHSNSDGAGIYLQSVSGFVLSDIRCSRNISGNDGGGLKIISSSVTLSNSIVTANDATSNGGGVHISGSLTVTTSTIALNSCGALGGGVHAAPSSTVKLSGTLAAFNTITCNSAGTDGNNVANLNAFSTSGVGNIDASFVCWGTTNSQAILSGNYDFFKNATLAVIGFNNPIVCDPLYDVGQGSELTGNPVLSGSGTLLAGSATTIALTGAEPSTSVLLIAGASAANLDFMGSTIVPALQIVAFLPTDSNGALSLPFTWPVNPPPTGTKLHVQVLNPTAVSTNGVATHSNALLMVQP